MSTSFWRTAQHLLAEMHRLGLENAKVHCNLHFALGAGKPAPRLWQLPSPGDAYRAQSFPASISESRTPALQLVRLQPKGRNTPGVETKPGKAVMGIPITAEEKRPWLLLHHGCALSQHGWVKPVRFSMVRCPKRLRVKLRTPNRRKEKAFSPQLHLAIGAFCPNRQPKEKSISRAVRL